VNPIIWTLIYSKFEGIDSCILQGLVLLILNGFLYLSPKLTLNTFKHKKSRMLSAFMFYGAEEEI
ncbi:hypothetical protein, partial [Faecalicoccus acidiformans]|uniref:hypothetical protein n=1 Tax=Faecalicoccus acidiformans TaxID=915173 RepID=UPI00320A7CDE